MRNGFRLKPIPFHIGSGSYRFRSKTNSGSCWGPLGPGPSWPLWARAQRVLMFRCGSVQRPRSQFRFRESKSGFGRPKFDFGIRNPVLGGTISMAEVEIRFRAPKIRFRESKSGFWCHNFKFGSRNLVSGAKFYVGGRNQVWAAEKVLFHWGGPPRQAEDPPRNMAGTFYRGYPHAKS